MSAPINHSIRLAFHELAYDALTRPGEGLNLHLDYETRPHGTPWTGQDEGPLTLTITHGPTAGIINQELRDLARDILLPFSGRISARHGRIAPSEINITGTLHHETLDTLLRVNAHTENINSSICFKLNATALYLRLHAWCAPGLTRSLEGRRIYSHDITDYNPDAKCLKVITHGRNAGHDAMRTLDKWMRDNDFIDRM